MIPMALCVVALVAGQVSDVPKATPSAEEARATALASYNAMRDKAPRTAAGQWKLATWCDQHGLAAEAMVHAAEVVRLDPSRDAAWKKLGFKKHDGRWMTDEQFAESEAQKAGEKVWSRRLKEWHKLIHGGKKQAEAQEGLNSVTDPHAVSSVYREFGAGGETDQLIAVQLLGQIDAPTSSKILAGLAIYGKTPEVRRRSVETLRARPPEDFLGLFVALMRDPLKYEVRPVGGPGSPGVLLVEGEQFNVRRFYEPPRPSLPPLFGSSISYDANGMPVATRSFNLGGPVGVKGSKDLVQQKTESIQYYLPNAALQMQQAALIAQSQLAGDVAQVEALNEQRRRFTEVVMDAAKAAIGKDAGKTAKEWRGLVAAKDGKYARRTPRSTTKPTLDEMVPVAFQYTFAAAASIMTNTYVDT